MSTLRDWSGVLVELLSAPNGMEALRSLLRYIFLVADRGTFEQVSETVQHLPAPIQVTGQTIAQWLEQRGREDGLREGEARGLREGLRGAVSDLCELLGVELTEARRAQLSALDLPGLEALRAHLKLHRAWPTG